MEQKIKQIEEVIKDIYGISFGRLISKDRSLAVVEARKAVCYLLRNKSKLSYPAIGRIVNRDHSSVIYNVNSFNFEAFINKLNLKNKQIIESLNNPNYQENQLPHNLGKYNKLFQLRGVKCEICGFDDVVEVHHLISRKSGGTNDLNNLIIVCPNHHSMIHHGLVKLNPNKFNFLKIPEDINRSIDN